MNQDFIDKISNIVGHRKSLLQEYESYIVQLEELNINFEKIENLKQCCHKINFLLSEYETGQIYEILEKLPLIEKEENFFFEQLEELSDVIRIKKEKTIFQHRLILVACKPVNKI